MKQNQRFASLKMALILICISNSCFALNIDGGINSAKYNSSDSSKVSLGDAIDFLMPKAIWENFYNLTKVPRPSHGEGQMSAYLANFGKDLALETAVDEVGNVLIRKPATPGMESRKGVILQAHMDMVAQKDADKDFDFQTDTIQAYIEDGWVKANGTTLGADDGVGVAIIMALLEDKKLIHGPLEALFTVNEEDGFTGVNGLKSDMLMGDIYINVDSETEGEFTIGSAGGLYIDAKKNYSEEETPAQMVGYKIAIKGLKGGHSGMDINLGRGNAAKILSRLLWTSQRLFGLRIATFSGGDRYNAIPREAYAVVVVPKSEAYSFAKYVQEFEATVQKELSTTEPSLIITAEDVDLPAKLMVEQSAIDLISAVYFMGGISPVNLSADYAVIVDERQRPKAGRTNAFGGGAGNVETEPVEMESDLYTSVMCDFSNGAKGNFKVTQYLAGRHNWWEITLGGSKRRITWNQVNPNEMEIGQNNYAPGENLDPEQVGNIKLINNPGLLAKMGLNDAKQYSPYPGEHPAGHIDAFAKNFRAAYSVARGEMPREQAVIPGAMIGFVCTAVADAVLRSRESTINVKVDYRGVEPAGKL